jgi:hypothetical protein
MISLPQLVPGAADPFDAGPYARLQAALRFPPPTVLRGAWKRPLAFAAIAWVPLLALAAVEGLLLHPNPREAFLLDASAHTRYLVAIPLLVAAEPWCLPRLALIARQFARAGLVEESDVERLEELRGSARRVLDQRGTEIFLAAAALIATVVMTTVFYPLGTASWVMPGNGGTVGLLSLAGWWRSLVSQPLFLILLGSWVVRLWVWSRFLWGVANLRLRLVAAHPDLAAGLRFLAGSAGAFAPVAFAASAVVAGTMGESILLGAPAQQPRHLFTILATVALCLLVFAGPTLVFVRQLSRVRLMGMIDYGALADGVGRRFEERWLRTDREIDQDPLSAVDFSALTDLYSIVSNVREMRLAPMGVRDLVPIIAAALLPFVPLVLVALPLDVVLDGLAGVFL